MKRVTALLDILRISALTLVSMVFHSSRHSSRLPSQASKRSWLTEFTFRLAKQLLNESKTQSHKWLRERQKILKMYSPAMLKVRYEKVSINGVPCMWCRPKKLLTASQNKRTIIYYHGGGYVIGSSSGYQNMIAQLAIASGANIISVDYRLAPEHHLPAAQEDALTVAEYFLKQESDCKIVLAGDSAGGGLCIATCLALSKMGFQANACVLISPWVAPEDLSGSMIEQEKNDILDREVTTRWINTYVNNGSPDDHRVSFLNTDLAGLPPTYIQAAGAEIFIDQIRAYYQRMQDHHISVELEVFEDLFHDFQTLGPLIPQAEKAIAMIGRFIEKQL